MKLRLIFLIVFIPILEISAQDFLSSESQQDSTRTKNNVGSIFYGQPGKAALYSLILPGGGQLYNKRYWKAPIVWGMEGLAIYNLAKSISSSRNATTCWLSTLDNGDPNGLELCSASVLSSSSITEAAFNARQSARSSKDVAWILAGAAHLLNVVEAFVDRHLINFDTSEDLSRHNLPNHQLIQKYDFNQITFARVTIPLSTSRQ